MVEANKPSQAKGVNRKGFPIGEDHLGFKHDPQI